MGTVLTSSSVSNLTLFCSFCFTKSGCCSEPVVVIGRGSIVMAKRERRERERATSFSLLQLTSTQHLNTTDNVTHSKNSYSLFGNSCCVIYKSSRDQTVRSLSPSSNEFIR